jgi:hypothetical protein
MKCLFPPMTRPVVGAVYTGTWHVGYTVTVIGSFCGANDIDLPIPEDLTGTAPTLTATSEHCAGRSPGLNLKPFLPLYSTDQSLHHELHINSRRYDAEHQIGARVDPGRKV